MATITKEIDGRLRLETPYDEAFIQAFKHDIPYMDREWVRHLKAWIVEAKHLKKLVSLCEVYWPGEVYVSTGDSMADIYATMYLTVEAPLYVVEAVYRALVKKLHPDINPGGHEEMTKVNLAYQKIKSLEGVK